MRQPRDSREAEMPGVPTPSTTAPTPTVAPQTRPRRRRAGGPFRSVTVLALAVVLAAACGGGDDAGNGAAEASDDASADDDAQAYIDAAAASLTSDPALHMDQATATCISTALVDVIGADALAASGITPEEFAEEDSVVAGEVPDDAATRLSDGLADCDIARGFTAMFVDGLGVELPADAVACLGENVDADPLNDAMAAFLVPPEDGSAAADATLESAVGSVFVDAVTACPPVVTALFLAEAPGTVTPDTEECVAAIVQADPDRVKRAMDGDEAAAQELGTEIGTSCADTLGS